MNTFSEFIQWMRAMQPQLDDAWKRAGKIEGVYKGSRGQRQVYALLSDEILGQGTFHSLFHPRQDNLQIFVDRGLEEALKLLNEIGYGVTRYQENATLSSFWERDTVESPCYELEKGISSIQLAKDPADLLLYLNREFSSQDTAVGRFTSAKEAHWFGINGNPDLMQTVQTNIMLNPYGKRSGNKRENEKEMEDRVIELMEAIIDKNIFALYQGRATTQYCIVNLPPGAYITSTHTSCAHP